MDRIKLPVIFRMFQGEVLALFPTEPAEYYPSRNVTCYAHVGQHSSANMPYVVRASRPATEAEYKDLLAELWDIYEDCDPEDGLCTLVVCKRRTPEMAKRFDAQWQKVSVDDPLAIFAGAGRDSQGNLHTAEYGTIPASS